MKNSGRFFPGRFDLGRNVSYRIVRRFVPIDLSWWDVSYLYIYFLWELFCIHSDIIINATTKEVDEVRYSLIMSTKRSLGDIILLLRYLLLLLLLYKILYLHNNTFLLFFLLPHQLCPSLFSEMPWSNFMKPCKSCRNIICHVKLFSIAGYSRLRRPAIILFRPAFIFQSWSEN